MKNLLPKSIALLWILRIVVSLGAIFMLLGIPAYFLNSAATDNAPSIEEAPWVVQTTSRYYYAESHSEIDGNPSITNYWAYDGKKYTYHEATLEFEKEFWGKVRIQRR